MRNKILVLLFNGLAALLLFVASTGHTSAAESVDGPVTPELADLPTGRAGAAIRYGFELLANTSRFIGPRGEVAHLAGNRMACQNCHLGVGTKPFGNSWLDTFALYPQYRLREGEVQTLEERINACLVHNLLGKPLPESGPEMKAIMMYYKWLGRGRSILAKDSDQRLAPLSFLSRPADSNKGAHIFEQHCLSCHGADGEGRLDTAKTSYVYPPLWGKESFVTGASLSRLSLMARFVKTNMPYGKTDTKPILSDEESWDVAAYILSHKRPAWKGPPPFRDLSEKPFDFPIGPYEDKFTSEQHHFGPFQPILDFWITQQGSRAQDPTTGI